VIAEVAEEGRRRVEAEAHGRVHGVGFRYFVQREAQRLGLGGWVRNLRSGSVQLVAEGPEKELKKLLEVVRRGPPMAWVERVDVKWREPKGNGGPFEITYTV